MQANFFDKRITVFAGHYGSGKTTLAVNCAVAIKKGGDAVRVCDLDIVNPYFKAADFSDALNENGIALICSGYAGSNLDVPALPPEVNSVFDDESKRAVIDLGGDEKGAYALGRYAERLKEERGYEMLLVINYYRPLTRDAGGLVKIKNDIERAAGVRFTGIINNSNLAGETTAGNIAASFGFAREISELTGLPVRMTSVKSELLGELADAAENIFPIHVLNKKKWAV